jgi:hypothetical protein
MILLFINEILHFSYHTFLSAKKINRWIESWENRGFKRQKTFINSLIVIFKIRFSKKLPAFVLIK